ncbi:MAG: (2Fe-2S) ferredoxin domain-containing protein, partial [Deltaproteobacteria bacterium]
MPRINSPAELEEFRQGILSNRDPNKPCITICSGSACHASGSKNVAKRIEEEIEKQGLSEEVEIRKTGCHGFCERGPIVVIHPEEICYLQIAPKDIPEIVSETVKGKKVIDRLLYTDPETGE